LLGLFKNLLYKSVGAESKRKKNIDKKPSQFFQKSDVNLHQENHRNDSLLLHRLFYIICIQTGIFNYFCLHIAYRRKDTYFPRDPPQNTNVWAKK